MNKLGNETVRLISSTQVITSVSSAVKEVVENCLDAGATNVDVKLEDFGLEKIEVRDNGCGIKVCDVPYAGQRHYTSKIQTHDDLQLLTTYGFRGEALGSLCELGDVTICTRTKDELHSTLYTLSSSGIITGTKPSHAPVGTTVIVKHLFKNLPVRKQFYNSTKKKKEQLKLTEDYLMAVSLAHPGCHVHFSNNKMLVWQKPRASTVRAALVSVLTSSVARNMVEVHKKDGLISVQMFLPKNLPSRKNPHRTFLIVNSRPVRDKGIDKILRKHANGDDSGWPVCLVIIQLPTETVDANVNANKTQVILSQKEKVLELIESMLVDFYDASSRCEKAGNESSFGSSLANSNRHLDKCPAVEAVEKTIPVEKSKEDTSDSSNNENLEPNMLHHSSTSKSAEFNNNRFEANRQSSLSEIVLSNNIECNIMEIPPNSPSHTRGDDKNSPGYNQTEINVLPDFNLSDDQSSVSLSSNSNKKPSEELWSRGDLLQNKSVQPVRILAGGRSALSNVSKTPSRKRSHNDDSMHQSTLDNLVTPNSKKPRSVFEVSGGSEKFDALPEEKQMQCISVAGTEWDNYQKQKKAEERKSRKLKPTERHSFIKPTLSEDEVEEGESEDGDFPIIEKMIDTNYGSLKNNIHELIVLEQANSTSKQNQPHFIAYLAEKSNVVFRNGPALFVANLMRLSEKVVFTNLLETYKLQCTKLDSPIALDEKIVGPQGLDVLDQLKTTNVDSMCPDAEILDPRITSNGFKVQKVVKRNTGRTVYYLCSMTLSVPYYSVQELKGILSKLHTNMDLSVKESRPSCVVYYLQGEAARISWATPPSDDHTVISSDLVSVLKTSSNVEEFLGLKCFHSKPIFHKLTYLKRYKHS
uniref:Mismatch repair endonuclease PMS2-like n=1 Tax=Phallusia mammillata TaxID=59560 RepID=A0A6F9DNE6_9ASCI|nr:mismatch repair endonuclease PMS2-like [Phallusia mammillata]